MWLVGLYLISSAVVVSMRTWLPKHCPRKKRVLLGSCRYALSSLCRSIVIVTDIYHGEIRFELNDDHHRHCHDKTFDKFLDSDVEATFE